MRKLALLIVTLIPALLVHLAHTHGGDAPVEAATQVAHLRRGAAEIGDGSFIVYGTTHAHPIAFVWVRDDSNGDPLETWLLFRENQTDGWVYPSDTNTNVTIRFEHASPSGIDDVQDFRDWAESQYDPILNVDESTDFGEHEHEVTIK